MPVELSGLDPGTVSRNIDVFVHLGVIEPTRGTSQLYSVNTDAELGKAREELRQHARELNEAE